MAEVKPISELDTTPTVYFDKQGRAELVRTFVTHYEEGEAPLGHLGWNNYTIGSDGSYYESYYDPHRRPRVLYELFRLPGP